MEKMRAKRDEQGRALACAGIDSDFISSKKHFRPRADWSGRTSENWSDWLRRIEEQEESASQLQRPITLHQRHRFDPLGLTRSRTS